MDELGALLNEYILSVKYVRPVRARSLTLGNLNLYFQARYKLAFSASFRMMGQCGYFSIL